MKLKTLPYSSCSLAVADTLIFTYNHHAASTSNHRNRNCIILAKSKKQLHSQGSDSDPAPPRITSNVKQNLQFLRLWKVGNSTSCIIIIIIQNVRNSKNETLAVLGLLPVTGKRRWRRTMFRTTTLTSTVIPPPPSTSIIIYTLSQFIHSLLRFTFPQTSFLFYSTHQGIDYAVPVLLVDGYNVCGYWMKLKKHFMKGRLDIARQKLIDELVTFSMVREVKVVAVFDAMMSGLPTHKENFAGIDVVFSGETCADTWIEKEVAALKEDGCPKVWVVTSDHCQQQAAHGAGAFVWSCKALVTEIKASQKEVERMLQEQRSTSFQGRLLKHNLDAEVVDALKNLRQKLSENELK